MARLLPRRRQDKRDKRADKNTWMGHTILSKKGLVECLWLTTCGNAYGPAGLLSMKLIKYKVYLWFFPHNVWQKLSVLPLNLKDMNTVILDLIVFSRNYLHSYITASKWLMHLNKVNENGRYQCF